jgi:hypothetical protein
MSILTSIVRFLGLPSPDRGLLLRIGLLVAVVRVVLWTRPWPSALRLARALPLSRLSFPRSYRPSADRLAWAVRHSSRLVPAATCLTQSLALQCALTAAGLPSRLEIGVAKAAGGELQSHAWVEHDGHTLLSTSTEVERYSRLLTLRSESASYPPHATTGIEGYFGKAGSVNDRRHKEKIEPRADTTRSA